MWTTCGSCGHRGAGANEHDIHGYDTIRYDTIVEFNVDSKAEYTAQSSTRSQQLKQSSAPLPDVAVL